MLVFKINFDGATKGNTVASRYGGFYRNVVEEILKLYFGYIGNDTNNSVELEGLVQGFKLVFREGWL